MSDYDPSDHDDEDNNDDDEHHDPGQPRLDVWDAILAPINWAVAFAVAKAANPAVCGLCRGFIPRLSMVIRLPCGHFYPEGCLTRHLNEHRKCLCPYCDEHILYNDTISRFSDPDLYPRQVRSSLHYL